MTDLPQHPAGVSLTPSSTDEGAVLHQQTPSSSLVDDLQDERPELKASTVRVFTAMYAIALVGVLLTKTPALT